MRVVTPADIRQWRAEQGDWSDVTRGIGAEPIDRDYVADVLRLPFHMAWAVEQLRLEAGDRVRTQHFDSIPFYSLCRGFFLPISGMRPEKAARVFGLEVPEPTGGPDREQLLTKLLSADIGLSLIDKLGCIVGDPFHGKPGGLKRDSLVSLLMSLELKTKRQFLDRLTVVGDVAVLFAESRPELRAEPPLTASEVLEVLRLLPNAGRRLKFDLLRSVLQRCGKLEAYWLAKLILRKAGFGFEYQGPLLGRALATQFGVPPEQITHAMALTDAFEVTRILQDEGAPGLRKIRLQPLVAVRPALASGSASDIKQFPVWVERKYDGIRFMLHKSTDSRGAVLCGAYTRNRGDWLELVPRLDATIKMLPCKSAIVDGELYGTVIGHNGPRPANVYEVYSFLQGDRTKPVNLRFAAFDLILRDGVDLTRLPLHQRRQMLSGLLGALSSFPLPVPLQVAEGQTASDQKDVNRLYEHFRNQGYEGVITKDPNGAYHLATRDPSWLKRKPMITLDLVLLGAVFAVTEKENVGTFGSYVIGIRGRDGGFIDVGDVAGLDRERDAQIRQEIMREGLLTGRRIERQSMSGTRAGVELRPYIVVTVKFEGLLKDIDTGEFKLRDPKVIVIRSDKTAMEADSEKTLEEMYLRKRVG